jgi:phenylacetic acid degradation operon negative regulatory protein
VTTTAATVPGDSVGQPRPKSLILDIYGAQVRGLGGWLAIANLVALMADLGHDDRAVRAAVARMKRSALLSAETRQRVAGYALTKPALEILRDGDERIFASSVPTTVAEGWVVAVFSVPEQARDCRHRLRALLVRLGFGQVTPGVWIAPSRMKPEARRLLARAGLSQYVSLFEGEYAGFSDLRVLVAHAWDLPALDTAYRRFIALHRRTETAWRAPKTRGNRPGFVDYMRVLAAWRRLAYHDPGLPPELLPRRWNGERARALFADLHATLAPRASAHVIALVADSRVAAVAGKPPGAW